MTEVVGDLWCIAEECEDEEQDGLVNRESMEECDERVDSRDEDREVRLDQPIDGIKRNSRYWSEDKDK